MADTGNRAKDKAAEKAARTDRDFSRVIVMLGLAVFAICVLMDKILGGMLAAAVFLGVAQVFRENGPGGVRDDSDEDSF